jgi:hypothetical protein
MVNKSYKDRSVFYYIYHSVKSRNDRRLKLRVLRDKKGKIMSERQRDTYYNKKDCLWLCYYSFNAVNKNI